LKYRHFLLEALCEAAGGFYFWAREGTDAESLAFLGPELGEFTGARPRSWSYILGLARGRSTLTFILPPSGELADGPT
jgi:hypothetical protein